MWSKLSLLAFFLSIISLVMLTTGINPLGLSYETLFYFGVFSFGLFGFIFSILSNFFDKRKKRQNPIQSFVYYLGMILVFVGVIFKYLHWPYTIYFFGTGIFVSLAALFIRFNPKESSREDLLDD